MAAEFKLSVPAVVLPSFLRLTSAEFPTPLHARGRMAAPPLAACWFRAERL